MPLTLRRPLAPTPTVRPFKPLSARSSGTKSVQVFKPQAGPQERFLACPADVCIYGGAAGGGKTFGLILDPARWAANVKGFNAVIFRRTYPEIMNEGGLWDESELLLPGMGGVGKKSDTTWEWPSTGSSIKFSHMQHESDVLSWQGAQIAFCGFDELIHFTEKQFWYMTSRLRSACGVMPYLRATCNPEVDSWVSKLIEWWIDQNTGFPIPERAGIIRWFVRINGRLIWGDDKNSTQFLSNTAMSFTFIPAKLHDNPALMAKDPNYLTKLQNLPSYERATLLEGNWKVRLVKGMLFRRESVQIIASIPTDIVKWARYWDRAATEPSTVNPDPDATSGTLMGRRANGRFVIADERNVKLRPMGVLDTVRNCSTQDPVNTEVWLEQDPGSAGVAEISYLSINLAGLPLHVNKVTIRKFVRAKPLAAQWELGNVDIVRGPWNEAYLSEMDGFVDEDQVDAPQGYHDDRVDSSSGCFNALMSMPMPGVR